MKNHYEDGWKNVEKISSTVKLCLIIAESCFVLSKCNGLLHFFCSNTINSFFIAFNRIVLFSNWLCFGNKRLKNTHLSNFGRSDKQFILNAFAMAVLSVEHVSVIFSIPSSFSNGFRLQWSKNKRIDLIKLLTDQQWRRNFEHLKRKLS